VTASACPNCGQSFTGRFCSGCGQKVQFHGIGLHEFGHEVLHELAHVDDKIGSTIRLLLLHPGALTREFFEGRRARYLSPLRLYLICSAIFFWLALTVADPHEIVRVGSGPPPKGTISFKLPGGNKSAWRTTLEHRIEIGMHKVEKDPRGLADEFTHALPKAMFVLMPFFALLLLMAERRRQPFYIPHLYFSIHLHAFAFLLLSLGLLLRAGGVPAAAVFGQLMVLLMAIYFYKALRTVYGDSRLGATVKTIVIAGIYLFCVGLVMATIILVTILNA
jgi:hypothetical protein